MLIRFAVLAVLMASQGIVPSAVFARNASLSRREIRQMPVSERPSRTGHFYGNSVRRNLARQTPVSSASPIVESGVPTPAVETGAHAEP